MVHHISLFRVFVIICFGFLHLSFDIQPVRYKIHYSHNLTPAISNEIVFANELNVYLTAGILSLTFGPSNNYIRIFGPPEDHS
jgi:hypothetical protein